MKFHPVAEIFTMIDSAAFELLKADIKTHGQREPIYLFEGKIIDGRNRFKACNELKIKPVFREWDGKGNLVDFVISLNLHRRHLSESQRAMVAAKTASLKKGLRQDRSIDPSKTQAQVAELFKISVPSIKRANQVQHRGVSELQSKIESGELSLNLATQISKMEREQQLELLKNPDAKVFKSLAPALSKIELNKRIEESSKKYNRIAKKLPDFAERFKIYNADIKNDLPEIPSSSVDLIICDPPYAHRHFQIFDYLGKFAQRVLKPNGSLLCLCGQHNLHEEMQFLSKYLSYYWLLSYQLEGGRTGIGKQRSVYIYWKPILWYAKGDYTGDHVSDICRADLMKNGRNLRKWEQSEIGIANLVQKFARAGMTICDPVMGSGTTGLATLRSDCFFIGIDKDKDSVNTAKVRLHKEAEELKQSLKGA
jgi:hypothetical protein